MMASAYRWTCTSLAYLVVVLPAATWAVCAAGGASSLPLPAITYLRSYRAPFKVPTRMAVDASGNIYVADPEQGQVIARAPDGHVMSRFADLVRPVSVAVGDAGKIYVGDAESGSVTAFTADWQSVFQLGHGAGEFLGPSDLAVDAATGNLYVADSPAHLVKVYTASGTFLQSFGGQGSDDGLFNFPVGVFVDAAARQVLVVDQLNYRVQVFDVAGNFQSCFGAQGSTPGRFNMPQGVVADGQGRVYVTDSLEGRVQVLDRSGAFVGYIGEFGDAPGQLRIPIGMVIDPSNRLFVAAANNARLEVFGLDTFVDPETILPAVIHVEPDPIDKADVAAVVGYIEVPGYSFDQIAPGSIVANGVSAAMTPVVIGDHDGNGVPDLRVEFDRTPLLATLPADGAGTLVLSGLLGTKHFEGSAVVHVTTCAPGTICPLGNADPQCNDAVCVAGVGCTVQPKSDGTGCEDGNACTIEDVCGSGACVGTALHCDDGNVCTDDACDAVSGCVTSNNSAACDDGNACTIGDVCSGGTCGGFPLSCNDGNACTDDSCDPTSGCVHTSSNLPCDDGNACTDPDVCAGGVCGGAARQCDDGNLCTDDACDSTSGCLHTNNTLACNDADPGTARDACDGAGRCLGHVVTGNYALLSWPVESSGHRLVTLAGQVLIRGDICTENIRVRSLSQIQGDTVAWASGGWAVALGRGSQIAGDVVTGGGTVMGIDQVTVGGRVDLSGRAMALADCSAARYRATSRRAEFVALPPSPGFALGDIQLSPGASRRIPSRGTFGAGQSVIEASTLRLGASSTLTLVGTAATDAVIVRIRGRMMLEGAAHIALDGLLPERVIFVVDGSVSLQSRASVSGSVFAVGRIDVGNASTINGALLGTCIDLAPSVTVNLSPFVGW